MRLRILFGLLFVLLPVAAALRAQSDGDFDHGLIAYSKTAPTGLCPRNTSQIARDEIVLRTVVDANFHRTH